MAGAGVASPITASRCWPFRSTDNSFRRAAGAHRVGLGSSSIISNSERMVPAGRAGDVAGVDPAAPPATRQPSRRSTAGRLHRMSRTCGSCGGAEVPDSWASRPPVALRCASAAAVVRSPKAAGEHHRVEPRECAPDKCACPSRPGADVAIRVAVADELRILDQCSILQPLPQPAICCHRPISRGRWRKPGRSTAHVGGTDACLATPVDSDAAGRAATDQHRPPIELITAKAHQRRSIAGGLVTGFMRPVRRRPAGRRPGARECRRI